MSLGIGAVTEALCKIAEKAEENVIKAADAASGEDVTQRQIAEVNKMSEIMKATNQMTQGVIGAFGEGMQAAARNINK